MKLQVKSIIPLNQRIESVIFNPKNLDQDCDTIWQLMSNEECTINALIQDGEIQEAAMLYAQLVKSICLHFVEDEHYNYFDDMYSPDYTLSTLTKTFNALSLNGKLPEATKTFLTNAWKEIQSTEAYYNYGVPSTELRL